MKIYKILSLLVVTAILAVSCEPIEERDSLSNSFDPNAIELSVEQNPPGSNKFTLKMNTKGVMGYWDYVVGQKNTDEVEVVFPVTGTHTFTFNVHNQYMTDGTPSSKTTGTTASIDVNITQLDVRLDDKFYHLAGETAAGKTWVFAGAPWDGNLWWYMAAPYNWEEIWWNAAGECCPPANSDFVMDAAAEINFTLLGDYTYTLDGASSEGVKWAFNDDLTAFTITDPTKIPGYQNEWGEPRANADGRYEVKELTAERMVLYTSETIQGGTGWIWVFVPKAK